MLNFNQIVLISCLMIIGCVCGFTVDTNKILPTTTPYHMAHIHPKDPLSSTWSFYCNVPGSIVQDGQVRNHGSDIRIVSNTGTPSFQVGIQGGEVGQILDLGSIEDMTKAYNCEYYTCFSGLQFVESKLVVPNNLKENTEIDLSKMTSDTAPIVLGHVYLVRIYSGESTLLFAKFIATSVINDSTNNVQAMTLRHQTMYVTVAASSGRGNCPSHSGGSVSTEAGTAISFSVISLVATIIIGVGNIIFLIYYFAFASKKRAGVYGTLQ